MKIVIQYMHILNLVLTRIKRNQSSMNYSLNKPLKKETQVKKIRIEYTDFDMIQNKKDTTRPSNVYYGINWGYRSDETMEKSLDTGDLLFYNFDCNKCFSPRDTLICKAQ